MVLLTSAAEPLLPFIPDLDRYFLLSRGIKDTDGSRNLIVPGIDYAVFVAIQSFGTLMVLQRGLFY